MTSAHEDNRDHDLGKADDNHQGNHQHALQQIAALRHQRHERPRNVRIMSQLACLLMQQVQTMKHERGGNISMDDRSNDYVDHLTQTQTLQREAWELTQQALARAPHKPYGYMAQSRMMEPYCSFSERMQALRQALECIENQSKHHHQQEKQQPTTTTATTISQRHESPRQESQQQTSQDQGDGSNQTFHPANLHPLVEPHKIPSSWLYTRIILHVRLLVEPRQEEARQVQGVVGRAAVHHPTRRALSSNEGTIYASIRILLHDAWQQQLQLQCTPMYSDTDSSTSSIASDATVAGFMNKTMLIELAQRELQLGLFFRKRQPTTTCQPRAIDHLQQAMQSFPPGSQSAYLAQFWLQTVSSPTPPTRRAITITTPRSSSGVETMTWNPNMLESAPLIDRCPPSYVINLYSTFANNFDTLLVDKLQYRTPEKLCNLVVKATCSITDHPIVSPWRRALDLGCGTGLSGLAFAPFVAESMVGIDLSPQMIAKAQHRTKLLGNSIEPCYQELYVADVETFGNDFDSTYRFDLVFACDVFVYLGNLSKVFNNVVKKLLTPAGIFAFSTEQLNDQNHSADSLPYKLQECARFAHCSTYLDKLAKEHEMDIVGCQSAVIRKNQGMDVVGLLYVLRKSAT